MGQSSKELLFSRQLSDKITFQRDICPRKLLPMKSLLNLIFVIFYKRKIPNQSFIKCQHGCDMWAPQPTLLHHTPCNDFACGRFIEKKQDPVDLISEPVRLDYLG